MEVAVKDKKQIRQAHCEQELKGFIDSVKKEIING
jgi:hypothetical protein